MNNKIFKRVVAAASCVAMLGTCAFATTLTVGETPYNASTGELTFSYAAPENATKVTYIAYAATEAETAGGGTNGTDYVFGEIVAVDQIDSGVTTAVTPKTVKISSDLLYMDADAAEADKVAATHIVLMAGNDLGTTPEPIAVPLEEEEPAVETYTVTFMDGETVLDTKTEVAKDTVISTLVAAPSKDKGTAKLNWGFVGWYTDANLTTALAADAVVTGDVTVYAKFVPVYIVGDVNGNGTGGDNADLNIILRYFNKKLTESQIETYKINTTVDSNHYVFGTKDIPYVIGDVNGNGTGGDNADLNIILRYFNKKLTDSQIESYGINKPLTIK